MPLVKPPPEKANVWFRSLGCPKNQVDTEVMLGALATQGYAVCETLEDADHALQPIKRTPRSPAEMRSEVGSVVQAFLVQVTGLF